MSFSNWHYLFLLFIPALILAWIWMRVGGRVAFPQDHGVARKGRAWDFCLNLFLSAAPLMLAMAIILLAGPRHLSIPKQERELTNIEFCLDLSGSMTAQFGEGSRYDAAMEAMNNFVTQREKDAYGLTVFGTNANHWIPLTTDPSAFRCATPFLNPRKRLPPGYGGGTMIGKALKKCQETLVERETGDRMIILVSDGESADLGDGREEDLARELRDDKIVVYSIHIGEGITPPEVSTITNITGGASFSPEDQQALVDVFQRIDRMQVAEMKRTYPEIVDWFSPFSICGLVFAGLSLISLTGLRHTPW